MAYIKPSDFKCVPIEGQEFESEKKGIFDIVLFKEFYLIDINGNAFKSKSDMWLVSKFIEVGNEVFTIGNLKSYKTYDDAWAATFKKL
jgi:hypothetical protein